MTPWWCSAISSIEAGRTREVIEVLIQVGQQCELILILGNHEEELLAARKDPDAFGRWLNMGG